MTGVVEYALLGLGAGAVYALLAQGIVLIYRASGVLNFAQGAMAMVGAFIFYELNRTHGWSVAPALIVSTVVLALFGALVYQLLMRPLRDASALARVIATLALLLLLQAVASIKYGPVSFFLESFLPSGPVSIGSIVVPQDRFWLTGIALVISAVLYVASRWTKIGLASLAVAESERSVASVGWSPDLLGTVNWALGGAMAAVAGILITPITSLSVSSLTLIVVPAMAAALIGGFSSFAMTLFGALLIGVLQSEVTQYTTIQGSTAAVPLVVIAAVLLVRGQSLPLRSHLLDRLPEIGAGGFRRGWAAALVAVAVLFIVVAPVTWVSALSLSLGAALILLSIVVVTGYAGQLSLAQYALAGGGALIAANLVAKAGWSFEPALLAGVIGAALSGFVLALPALRARGLNLAIVTLAGGLAASQVLFANQPISGAVNGLPVGPQSFFGISLNALEHPGNYAVFSVVCLLLVTWGVCNLRVGRAGRRLIAVRTNERAAASLGISVFKAKLYAFSLSAALAGLGGIVIAFQNPTIYFEAFNPVQSVNAVLLAVVGSIGFVLGPLFGATLVAGGFPGGIIASHISNGGQWLALVGAVAVLLILISDPNGLARSNGKMALRLIGERGRARLARHSAAQGALLVAAGDDESGSDPAALRTGGHSRFEIRDLTVRYGGVVAVDGLSISVGSGEVIGLIGPNGAGKTTLIDAATGFTSATAGHIALDDKLIDRWSPSKRASNGVTRSFQSLELFDDISVLDNIRAACDNRDDRAYLSNLVRSKQEPLSASALAAIKVFHLEDDLERRPDELSYGRRRLVAIARAAATSPSFLLLDEPVAGMGETEAREVGQLIRRLADEWRLGVILIEHDISVVMSTCDRIVVIDFGKKIAEGTPEEIQRDPAVIAAYLGVEDVDDPIADPFGAGQGVPNV